MNKNKSEVAQLLQNIATEYESARRGLRGLAISAPHAYITARLKNVAFYAGELRRRVGDEQAFTLLTIMDRGEECKL